jgi:hypothetical protein
MPIPHSMRLICARQEGASCPLNQNYYSCRSGSYAGCCSHDPCLTGMCDNNPADGQCIPSTLTITQTVYDGTASLTTPTNRSAANYGIGSATFTVGTSLSTGNVSSIASDTTVRNTATATQTHLMTLASTNATAGKPSPSKPSTLQTSAPSPSTRISQGAIAGSVIGSIVGLILLCILLLYCCQHRKKLRVKLRLKRTGNSASDAEENEKDLKIREQALREAERRKSAGPLYGDGFGSPPERGQGFVIERGMGLSPTGSGERGTVQHEHDPVKDANRWI